MSEKPYSGYRSLVLAAIVMAVLGWLGLYMLTFATLPTVGPRWLFFFLWVLATTGTAIPFIWLLHRRFSTERQAPSSVLLRQSLWIGLFGSLCLWLQFNRTLTLSLAILLGVRFTVMEWFLGLVERSRWRPNR
jgi:hypothetical protein